MMSLSCKASISTRLVTRTRQTARVSRVSGVKTFALLGGGDDSDDSKKKQRFITREEEPEEYWRTPGEMEGGNPLKDPLALMGVFAILFPFVFVLGGILTGAIDTTGGR